MNFKSIVLSKFKSSFLKLKRVNLSSGSSPQRTLKVSNSYKLQFFTYLTAFSYLSMLAIFNSVSYAQEQNPSFSHRILSIRTIKSYAKRLGTNRRSLNSLLKQLQKNNQHAFQSTKTRKVKERLLAKLTFTLDKTYEIVSDYFQEQRPQKLNHEIYLKLRKQVWLLLDRKVNLFVSSKGRFCLRAVWERLIAKSYLTLNHDHLAQHHFLRAYRCAGSNDDLHSAQNIQQTKR